MATIAENDSVMHRRVSGKKRGEAASQQEDEGRQLCTYGEVGYCPTQREMGTG